MMRVADFKEELLAILVWHPFLRPLVLVGSIVFLSLACQPNPPAVPVAPPPPVPAAINYAQPLLPGQVALRKIPPGDYPDFAALLSTAHTAHLRSAAEQSLDYLARPSSRKNYPYLDIDHERAVASLRAFVALIDSGFISPNSDKLNQKIAEQFEVYQSIGGTTPDGGTTNQVLFTGYFTPTYDASLTRTETYQWPLYGRPGNYVYDSTTDTTMARSADGATLTACPTRQEIESGALAGHELVWLADRWSAYVITVQGSARLRMPDGTIMEVGYAGSNGREYASPGRKMVQDGMIAESDLSFETMRRYFQAHPEAMDTYLWQNPRTVFFAEVHGGPFGCLNVPVTPMASIATDKAVYPAGMPAFLMLPMGSPHMMAKDFSFMQSNLATEPTGGFTYGAFMFDQDRGGAIRSAGRCDIYMGIGNQAGETAGHQLSAGALYYLAVKPQWVGKYGN